jgi:hypothetical protein
MFLPTLKRNESVGTMKNGKLSTAILVTMGALLLLSAFLVLTINVSAATSSPDSFNHPGNVLITDQFNNRVIEVNPSTKDIVWSFGSGNPNLCNPGPTTIIGSNWAERLSGGLTIMAGTGTPPNTIPQLPNGCADNRVIVVNQQGKIVWQYGKAGVTGSGPNELNVPVSSVQLPNHDILITDQANERVIEVNLNKQIVWQYGMTGVAGKGFNQLNNPNSAELLPNGHILIADENNNRTIEVTRSHQIVWQDGQGLFIVAFASRLPNGDTLITDSGHARIVEVTPQKQVVFEYFTNTAKNSNANPLPTNAVELRNGNIAIADQFNSRALIINPKLVFQYGMTNVTGNKFNQLYDPYTAFVIGDFTGQTPPPGTFLA